MVNRLTFSLYGVCFIASFVLSFCFAGYRMKRHGVRGKIIFYSMFLNLCTILYGGKEYTVITGGFKNTFLTAGFSGMGGVMGLLLGVLIFRLIVPNERSIIAESYIQAIPLLYAVSKLGCFSVGCCKGIPYDGPFSITYDTPFLQAGPLFPVQMSESVTFAVIFGAGILIGKTRFDKYNMPVIMGLCAAAKCFWEIFREEYIPGHMSANRIMCIIFVLISVVWISHIRRKIAPSRD